MAINYEDYLYKLPDWALTLKQIASIEGFPAKESTLYFYAANQDKNDFPEPYARHGNRTLYDARIICRWVTEHMQMTQGWRHGKRNLDGRRPQDERAAE